MANTKLTKKDLFGALLEIEEVKANETLVEFINHEVELLNKKRSGKSEKQTQEQNEIMEQIYNALVEVGKEVTITELQKANEIMAIYSNQKISAYLKKLVDTNKVAKVVDKKKSYFKAIVD